MDGWMDGYLLGILNRLISRYLKDAIQVLHGFIRRLLS